MSGKKTYVDVDYPNEHVGIRKNLGKRLFEVLRSPTAIAILLSLLGASSVPWWGQPLSGELRPLLLSAGVPEGVVDMVIGAAGIGAPLLAILLLVALFVMVYRGLDEDVLLAQRQEVALNRLAMLTWMVRRTIEADDKMDDIARSSEAFSGFLSRVASAAERIFSVLVRRGRIGVAIRVLTQDERNNDIFPTVARAGNLSDRRELTSEPLVASSGVIEIASSRGESSDAVFYINDARAAFDAGVLSRDFNSENEPYASEVLSMAFTRINILDPGDDGRDHDELIGIFYVTSDVEGAFDGIITSYMVVMADLLSLFLERIAVYGSDV